MLQIFLRRNLIPLIIRSRFTISQNFQAQFHNKTLNSFIFMQKKKKPKQLISVEMWLI